MRSKDLYQGDLESWNFAMQENASQIQLNLKADVYIGSVDGRRPCNMC